MFVQIVHIHVKPGLQDRFLEVFQQNVDGSRNEPGNVSFDVLQDPEDETHFAIYEVFRSEADLDAHRQTDHFKATVAAMAKLVTDKRSKEVYRRVR